MLYGVDISSYQDNFTYSGYDFYIMKASEGNGYKDSLLDTHYNNLHKSNDGKPDDTLLYGFYHYARPDLGNTPEEEADYFLKLVGYHAGHCIYALDWEAKALNYPAEWALAWLNRVYEKTGSRPLFYTSASHIANGKYNIIRDNNYGLWIAHYDTDKPALTQWPFWAMWQYTSNPFDKNYFNGNAAAWRKYCNPAGSNETVELPLIDTLKVGDVVEISSGYYTSTDPIEKAIPVSKLARNFGTVTKILKSDVHNPYLLDNGFCWVNKGDIRAVNGVSVD